MPSGVDVRRQRTRPRSSRLVTSKRERNNIRNREQIVAAARGWVGTPYRHQASLKGIGADCLGLVRGVWRRSERWLARQGVAVHVGHYAPPRPAQQRQVGGLRARS